MALVLRESELAAVDIECFEVWEELLWDSHSYCLGFYGSVQLDIEWPHSLNSKSGHVDFVQLRPEAQRRSIDDIDFLIQVSRFCKVPEVKPIIEAHFRLVFVIF